MLFLSLITGYSTSCPTDAYKNVTLSKIIRIYFSLLLSFYRVLTRLQSSHQVLHIPQCVWYVLISMSGCYSVSLLLETAAPLSECPSHYGPWHLPEHSFFLLPSCGAPQPAEGHSCWPALSNQELWSHQPQHCCAGVITV